MNVMSMNEFKKDMWRKFILDLSYTVIITTMIMNVHSEIYAFLNIKNLRDASMERDVKGKCTPMTRKVKAMMSAVTMITTIVIGC